MFSGDFSVTVPDIFQILGSSAPEFDEKVLKTLFTDKNSLCVNLVEDEIAKP